MKLYVVANSNHVDYCLTVVNDKANDYDPNDLVEITFTEFSLLNSYHDADGEQMLLCEYILENARNRRG